MAGGINIPFIADVRNFLRGTRNVEESLEDVADSLDDLAREAQKAGERAGEGIEDGVEEGVTGAAREADDAADKLEKSFREAFDSVKRESRDAGDSLGKNVKDGTDRAGEGLDEFKDEANSTAREAAASFSGSFDDVADVLQEVAANAFAGFGPAGAAAGLAAAAGIGMLVSALQESADEVNENKDRVVELAKEISEVGGRLDEINFAGKMRDWGLEIVDAKSWFEPWQKDAVTRFEDIERKAGDAGVSVSDLFRGMSGSDPEAAIRVMSDLDGKIADLTDDMSELTGENGELARANGSAVLEIDKQIQALQGLKDEVQEQSGVTEKAIELQQRLDDAIGGTTEETQRAVEAQESFKDALEETADPVSTYEEILSRKEEAERVTAEATAAATEDASDSWEDYANGVSVTTQDLIDEWNRQAEEAAAFEDNLAIIAAAGGQALADELRAKGPEVAGSVADVLAKSSPAEQRAAIEAHARATGKETSDAIAQGVTDNQGNIHTAVSSAMDGLPTGTTTVRVEADLTAAQRAIRNFRPVITGVVRAGQAVV